MPKLSTRNDIHEFRPLLAEIEESPVSPLGRTTFWLVVAVFLFFVAWTILGQIDIVVTGNGKVIPDGQVKIIQPLDTGVINKILVKEGDRVRKNQVLMEIDPSSVEPEVESAQKNLNYTRLEGERIKATLDGSGFSSGKSADSEAYNTQLGLYTASRNSLEKQLRTKEEELKKVEQQMQAARVDKEENEKLLAVSTAKEERLRAVLDIIAKDDYEKVKNDILTYQDKVKQAEYKIEELSHQQSQTTHEIEQIQEDFRTTNLKDLADKQKQATDLVAKLEESSFKNRKQAIVSPVDGYIATVFIHTVGGVVTPAEKLFSVVPSNTPLLVQATVLDKDIGFVDRDMPVAIKVDTFEFQKYGMFNGKVKLVPHDSREDEKLGLVYDVLVTPTTPFIVVEGKQKALSPGLSVNAEIKVGKRRIIEFFIYPLIKYLHEGMSVR